MQKSIKLTCALLSLALSAIGWGQDTNSEADKIRKLDGEWAAAAGAKDVEKTVSYYADGAVVFAPNAPAANTKEAIREGWKQMLTAPGASLSWKTSNVEVSKSGDLAYVTGTYEDTMNDASGKPMKDKGNYVAVFKKGADGTWKCVVDIWNSEMAKK